MLALIAGATVLLWCAPSFAATPSPGPDCGAGAAIIGSDSAGKITLGASPALSCTLTFVVPYTNAPACSATNETDGPKPLGVATAPSYAVIGTIYPWTAGDVISYMCVSY